MASEAHPDFESFTLEMCAQVMYLQTRRALNAAGQD
jgi:hypothetical protein